METNCKQEFINDFNHDCYESSKDEDLVDDIKSKDKDHIFHSFRDALITTIKWIQMSSLFTNFFYSDTVFKAIQDKINDPQQASCVPFVLLSIFTTDMQMLEEIYHPHSNFQYTFIFNLQQWLRNTIDKLTAMFISPSSKETIETFAIESFDSIVNILSLKNEQNDDDEETRLLEKLSIDDIEQDNDQFLVEAKTTMLSKLNYRKRLIERYVTVKWNKMSDYLQEHDQLNFCLVQNSEKCAKVFDQISTNFQQLKSNTISINQTVTKICQAGIDHIDIYLSDIVQVRDKQSSATSKLLQSNEQKKIAPTKINNEYHSETISEENESVQAYELFRKINEQMRKANFFDFPILFDEFY